MQLHNYDHKAKSSDEFISLQDMISINALVEQLAAEKNIHRENCYFLLETELGVTSVKFIKRSDYDQAIKYLVDLQAVSGPH